MNRTAEQRLALREAEGSEAEGNRRTLVDWQRVGLATDAFSDERPVFQRNGTKTQGHNGFYMALESSEIPLARCGKVVPGRGGVRGNAATVLLIMFTFLLILACGSTSAGIMTGVTPRWACPSPMPLPYGENGPVKSVDRIALGTATPTGDLVYEEQPIYYEIWEQEYGHLASSPPYPSPTPYALIGTSYALGQRVEIGPLFVLVEARPGPMVAEPGLALNQQQLYFIELTWSNRSLNPIGIDYGTHVLLRAITDETGAVVSDSRWALSALALQVSGLPTPPAEIPSGTSQVIIPVLAPAGEPETVELLLEGRPGYFPLMPSSTTLPGTPTATPLPELTPTFTPLPNVGLRAGEPMPLRIQWSNAVWKAPGAPACGDPGALTDWSNGSGVAWGNVVPVSGVVAPPGAARVVQIALNQLGKRYVWGAKGPEQFDCSGLVSWSYAQIGLRIPAGTAGQWPGMTQVDSANLLPGDLAYFDLDSDGRVDHVGMLVGDLNGNGQWDMVHAANPKLGVRMDYDVLTSAAYGSRLIGFRTARV